MVVMRPPSTPDHDDAVNNVACPQYCTQHSTLMDVSYIHGAPAGPLPLSENAIAVFIYTFSVSTIIFCVYCVSVVLIP